MDIFVVGVIFVVLAITFILYAYLWAGPNGFRGKIDNVISNQTMLNSSTQTHATNLINNFGNGYFLNSSGPILIFFYFMLIGAAFISASKERADPQTLPLALPVLIIAILVSMPISDFAHAFITSSIFTSVAVWFKGVLYITDYLPVFTGLGTLGYIVFVVTSRGGGSSGGVRVVQG